MEPIAVKPRAKPRGTGTLRRKRWDKLIENWLNCSHICLKHGKWGHKTPPNATCDMAIAHDCEKCLLVEAVVDKIKMGAKS